MTADIALADPEKPGIAVFADAYPRAVDIPQSVYHAEKDAYDAAATAAGYRLAGFRLERAVFSTKP